MAATLTWLAPHSYVAATNPVAFVYHIEFPADDLLNPAWKVYKVNSANNVVTQIGLYQSLEAAQSACQTDYTGPTFGLLYERPPKTVYA